MIWVARGDRVAPEVRKLFSSTAGRAACFVSPISAWEGSLLAARGKLVFSGENWFSRIVADCGFELAPVSPDVMSGAAELPGDAPDDIADRIVIATARAYDMRIVTRDRTMLRYARKGYAKYLAC